MGTVKDNPKMAKNIGVKGVEPPQFAKYRAERIPGQPTKARARIQSSFLNALADDFDKHGRGAIEYCRRNDPTAYVKVCASLMPKEFKQVSPLEEMTEAELVAAVEHIRSKIIGNLDAGIIETSGTESIN
jgi:hypothetical protein